MPVPLKTENIHRVHGHSTAYSSPSKICRFERSPFLSKSFLLIYRTVSNGGGFLLIFDFFVCKQLSLFEVT